METRDVVEIRIYRLILNPMRGNTEHGEVVAIAYERQKLIDWYNSLLAPEPYCEAGTPSFDCQGDSHTWRKSFIKGSELEWFNPHNDMETLNSYGHGISDVWGTQEQIKSCGILLIT